MKIYPVVRKFRQRLLYRGLGLVLVSAFALPANASSYRTFNACVVARGGVPLNKAQMQQLNQCKKNSPKDKAGFEKCLVAAGVPYPSSQEVKIEDACRSQMYKKN
jgi:uncharacterized membrane protein